MSRMHQLVLRKRGISQLLSTRGPPNSAIRINLKKQVKFKKMNAKQNANGSDGPDTGPTSASSSPSIDEIVNTTQHLQESDRSLSRASLRVFSQPVRPGENIQPRYQSLSMDWAVLSEDQTRSTVFGALPLENLLSANQTAFDSVNQEEMPLLSAEQDANMTDLRGRIGLQTFEILYAIHRTDLGIMSVEKVESILSIAPSEVDAHRLQKHRHAHPNIVLSENEQFLLNLATLERLEGKLAVMLHMGTFHQEVQVITEKLSNLLKASKCLLDSAPFKLLIQFILSLENKLIGEEEGRSIKGFVVSRMNQICGFVLPSGQSLLHILASYVRDPTTGLGAVLDLIPVLQLAAETPYRHIVESVSRLEEGNVRADQELKEGGANPKVTDFLENIRKPLDEVFQHVLTTKDNLYFLLGFMAEPMPHSNQFFEPETFFRKVADFLEALKNIVENEKQQ